MQEITTPDCDNLICSVLVNASIKLVFNLYANLPVRWINKYIRSDKNWIVGEWWDEQVIRAGRTCHYTVFADTLARSLLVSSEFILSRLQ